MEYALGAATVAVSWSRYLLEFLGGLGIHLPVQIVCSPFEVITLSDGTVVDGGLINLPAILVVCLLSLLLIRGTEGSALMNNVLVTLKLLVVVMFLSLIHI